jgi:hypothetical protein
MSHTLRSKIGIVAELEKFDPMRLQLVFFQIRSAVAGLTTGWLLWRARSNESRPWVQF